MPEAVAEPLIVIIQLEDRAEEDVVLDIVQDNLLLLVLLILVVVQAVKELKDILEKMVVPVWLSSDTNINKGKINCGTLC